MTAPRVTVLMAVHNGAAYVAEAVESILRQTFTDFEFVIIDDGSTDDTAQRLAAFRDQRIRVLRNQTNIGLARSLNRGLAVARGALVARQDADDRSQPDRLRIQVAFLDRHPDVVVLGAQARYIDDRGRQKSVAPWPKSTSPLAIRWQMMFDGPFIHTSVMFRGPVIWDELGGYDESFVASQDFELWSRVASRGYEMRNLPDWLVDFRVHPGSVTTKYNPDRIAKLRPVFLRTLIAEVGEAGVPEGWPDTWVSTTYPGAPAVGTEPVTTVARSLEQIHEQFVRRHPTAEGDVQIRRHLAAMLIRLANRAAADRRARSVRLFARAWKLAPALAARSAPRYVGHLLAKRRH